MLHREPGRDGSGRGHGAAAFPARGSAASAESRRWATGPPHAAALPGAGTCAPVTARRRTQSGMRGREGPTSCPAYASRPLARKFGGSPRSDGDLAAAGRPLGYFRPAGPTEAGRHRLERAARVAGNARCPAPCGAARPIPGAAADRRPRPPEAGLTSLRVCRRPLGPGRPWERRRVAHARGAFTQFGSRGEATPPAPHTPRCQNFPLAPALPQMSGLAHSSPVSPT